jgi:hypothetical protein
MRYFCVEYYFRNKVLLRLSTKCYYVSLQSAITSLYKVLLRLSTKCCYVSLQSVVASLYKVLLRLSTKCCYVSTKCCYVSLHNAEICVSNEDSKCLFSGRNSVLNICHMASCDIISFSKESFPTEFDDQLLFHFLLFFLFIYLLRFLTNMVLHTFIFCRSQ